MFNAADEIRFQTLMFWYSQLKSREVLF